MGKEIIKLENQEWYRQLVEECRATITEAIFNSRWALVEGYWKLGERICEDELKIKKGGSSLRETLQGLAKLINTSERTLYYAVEAYRKFPFLDKIPEGKNISWNKLVALYLPEPKKEKTPELPKGKYQVIYVDPPWSYGNSQFFQEEKGVRGKITSAADLHYPVMEVEELKILAVQNLADENCILFMWTSSPHLEFAIQIINTWGFEYKTIAFVWDKQKVNPSAYTLSQIEVCLVAKRGSIPEPRGDRNVRQFLSEERLEHSQKPNEIRKRIERMFPTQKKIELFARQKTKGWDVWGNEI